MATTPVLISENVSELAPTLKVRHVGRTDPWSMKARKGLKQQFMIHGKVGLHRTRKRPKRSR
jgi:hypothetical protein